MQGCVWLPMTNTSFTASSYMGPKKKLELLGIKKSEFLPSAPETSGCAPTCAAASSPRALGHSKGAEGALVLLASWDQAPRKELPWAGRGQCRHRRGFHLHSIQQGFLKGSWGDLFLVSHGLQLPAKFQTDSRK